MLLKKNRFDSSGSGVICLDTSRITSVISTNDQELTVCVQLMAVDKDTGRNAELQYSLKSGRGKSKFIIDFWTGHIFAQKSLTGGQEFDLTVSYLYII